jgi:SAM-dependent methyltransferase
MTYMDIFGNALLDYWQDKISQNIITHSSLEEQDIIPVDYLFRSYKKMPELEQKALSFCKGSVLDIGAGAGSHSLYLQEKGYKVTAIDLSKGAAEVCKLRGIQSVIQQDIYTYASPSYDTLLLLMNGTGLAGTLQGLGPFLDHLKSLLNKGGQILIEGTDILYMYESDQEDGGYWIPEYMVYYGETNFTMSYKGKASDSFPWLYLDFNTLARAAEYHGFSCKMVYEGPSDNYLAKLTHL